VESAHGTPVGNGPVHTGTAIRLRHFVTNKHLHSHNHPSPVSKQQEITCYPGDANDNFRLEVRDGSDAKAAWVLGTRCRLVHVNTNKPLHSHTIDFAVNASDRQQEVCCYDRRDDNDLFFAQGVAMPVQYGMTIRMQHALTGRLLHSHAINYTHPRTSGQQQVTGFMGHDDNDLWIVRGAHGHGGAHGHVHHGATITLSHKQTNKQLHSHNHPSPAGSGLEVTAFAAAGDANDNWRLEMENGSKDSTWTMADRVRLVHVNTNRPLHSHPIEFQLAPDRAERQQEVTTFDRRDDNDFWLATL